MTEERNEPEENFHDTERKLRDRIEDLEARLAKAVEALRLYACACDGGFCHANENFCGWTATAVLAEIEGGKKDD